MLALAASILFHVSIPVDTWTDPVGTDADDPAIVYRGSNSLILGTDKTEAPNGGLAVFNLNGKKIGGVTGLDRPNNVDVVQRFKIGKRNVTLAVVTERAANQLRIFEVTQSGKLVDLTGSTKLSRDGKAILPMGVATYQAKNTNFVTITPKEASGPGQCLVGTLKFNSETNKVDFQEREWKGPFSGKKETESVAIEPKTGTTFYSDEGHGVWKIRLNQEPKLIANPLHTGDHEGLAFLNGKLISTDQRKENTYFWAYDLQTSKLLGSFSLGTDETDGIDICARPMGTKFPKGIMVAMNSKGKNFAIVDVRKISNALK
ncbi:MAG TPA: phytase [Fimbriimonas sp.]|nr:phytase [Fimbriimonas sp.]